MHDIDDLERRGIPGVMVASAPFDDAADTQSAVLTPHPIQDRTDDEMRAMADDAVTALVAALTAD